jgi:ferrous iron transport protein B
MKSNPELAKEFKIYSAPHNSTTEFTFKNPWVKLFFGEFGIITMTITYLCFLLLPLVVGFYFVMALLEDSGYLPRLATLLDRTLSKIGLNGRAVIPILLGFGCVTMATITTRLLGTEREKTIATAILQFVIPCSAQLAVIAVLMSQAGLVPFTIYVMTIVITLISLSTILHKTLPGESSPLLIDLPAMRIPRLDNIIKKMFFRTYGFMKEASFWFFVGAVGIGIMDMTGILNVWQQILSPFTTSWLKLPKEAANAFVMGMIRRDFGAAGLFDMHLTPMQITVAITTITLFVPCIASFVVMLKERGIKQGLVIWTGTWIFAFTIGGILAQIFS